MRRKGFTMIEMITVLAIIAVILATVIPRMQVTPAREVRSQAYILIGDLELARTKAVSAKSDTRLVFDVGSGSYTGYMDDNHDGVINETASEEAALGGFGTRTLPSDVLFGQGVAPALPSISGTGPITFTGSRLNFNNRGLTTPFQTRGAVYLVNRDDPSVVAAVAVSGAGSFRVWIYENGVWQ